MPIQKLNLNAHHSGIFNSPKVGMTYSPKELRINKLWYIQRKKDQTAIKRNELLI
jgi:hypothetical protein